MLNIAEVMFVCDKCGKVINCKNIEIVEKSYNQYVIDVLDQEEENFEAHCECELED